MNGAALQKPSWLFALQDRVARATALATVLSILAGYTSLAVAYATAYWYGDLLDGSPRFIRCLYFSVITQTTVGFGDVHPADNGISMFAVLSQATAGLFLFAFASALLVFKLLQPSGNVFVFDRHAVYYPDQGVLRIRALNRMPSPISNIEVKVFLRTWLDLAPHGRYATYDIPLKRTLIPEMLHSEPWFVVTQPAIDAGKDVIALEAERRLVALSPLHINERARITVTLAGNVDGLKSSVSGSHSYQRSEIVCGQFRLIDPTGLTAAQPNKLHWDNWDKFEETSTSHCNSCRFVLACSFSPRTASGDVQVPSE